ncbi:hypothetical protein ACTXT7_010112 [Hymenolepis weldensis]
MENAMLSSLNQHFEEKDGIASHKSLSIAYGWSLEDSQGNLEMYIKKHPEVKPVFRISGFQCMNNDQWNVDALACFDKSLEQDPVSHPSLVSFPWKYIPPNSSASAKIKRIISPKPSVKPQPKMEPITKISSPRKSIKRPPPKSRFQSSLKFEPKKNNLEKPSEKAVDIPDPFADSDEDMHEEEAKFIRNKRRRLVFSCDEEEDNGKKSVESKTENKSGNDVAKIKIDSPPKPVSEVSAKASMTNHKLPQKEKPPGKSASKKDLVPVSEDAIKGVQKKSSKNVTSSMKEEKKRASKVKEDSDEEGIELVPAQGVKKARSPSPLYRASTTRKRQVTKTFMDEDDGFLITERVWEEVDESELKTEESKPPKLEPAVETKKTSSPVKPTVTLNSQFGFLSGPLCAQRVTYFGPASNFVPSHADSWACSFSLTHGFVLIVNAQKKRNLSVALLTVFRIFIAIWISLPQWCSPSSPNSSIPLIRFQGTFFRSISWSSNSLLLLVSLRKIISFMSGILASFDLALKEALVENRAT